MRVCGADVVQIAVPFGWLGIVLASLVWAVLVVQVAVLPPRLDRRARLILARGSLPRPRLHLAYVALDGIKVVLLPGLYRRNALRPHVDLAARIELTPAHFTRWLSLWTAVVEERHTGETAEHAKLQAARIAGAISRRLYGRSLPGLPTARIEPPDQRLS